MPGLEIAILLLACQESGPPAIEARVDDGGWLHCSGRTASPDGARIKVWVFAGPVENGRGLDFCTVEVRSGAFAARLKPADGERVPGRYTVVARIDPSVQPPSVSVASAFRASLDLRVGTAEELRRFEDSMSAELETSLEFCLELSARIGRDRAAPWEADFAEFRKRLLGRRAYQILGWEPRLRRALEESEELLRRKAGGGGGLDSVVLDRALARRGRWMVSKTQPRGRSPEVRALMASAQNLAAGLETWPEAGARRSAAREFSRVMMQLACETPFRAYDPVLKAATAGRETFQAWMSGPARPEDVKAIADLLREAEKALAAANETP